MGSGFRSAQPALSQQSAAGMPLGGGGGCTRQGAGVGAFIPLQAEAGADVRQGAGFRLRVSSSTLEGSQPSRYTLGEEEGFGGA